MNDKSFNGYCLKCKANKTIKDAKPKTTKNHRKMMVGDCSTCGTKVCKFLSNK